MSQPEDTKYGRCQATARSTDEQCGRAAVGEHGKCDMHGGKAGAPEGNQNAVGNDGGAPEKNQNAMKTGLTSDPVGLFEYLKEEDPGAAQWIVGKLVDYASEVEFDVFEVDATEIDSVDEAELQVTAKGDDLLQMCVRDYARWRGAKRQLKEGLITKQKQQGENGTYEIEDSNPVNLDLDRADRTSTKVKKEYGALNDPESQKADEMREIRQMWAEDVRD